MNYLPVMPRIDWCLCFFLLHKISAKENSKSEQEPRLVPKAIANFSVFVLSGKKKERNIRMPNIKEI